MTVTNVLHGRDKVTAETRVRVVTAIRELDYMPVRSASQNRHVETRAIGVVFDFLHSPSFGVDSTFHGLHQGARQHNYDVLLLSRSNSADDARSNDEMFLDRRTDGLIIVNPRYRQRLLKTLVRQQVPTVLCYSSFGPAGVGCVLIDNREAMRLAVEHLVERGHTKIAHLAGPGWNIETRLRREGYRRAMRHRSLDSRIFEIGFEGRGEAEAVDRLLQSDATAVVCWNDTMALNVWRQAQSMGRHVPEDLAIIGVDDGPAAAEGGLTSIPNPYVDIGRHAVDRLLRLMKGESLDDCRELLLVHLVARASTTPSMQGSTA